MPDFGTPNTSYSRVAIVDAITGLPVASGVPTTAGGNVAAGAADSGNPVKVGGVYNLTAPTLDTGDRGDLQQDSRGNLKTAIFSADSTTGASVTTAAGSDTQSNTVNVLQTRAYKMVYSPGDSQWQRQIGSAAHGTVSRPFALPSADWAYAAAAGGIVNDTAITIKAAAGASVRNYITGIDAVNTHATVATEIAIRDGAAGTVLWRTHLPAAGVGGRVSIQFATPIKSTANTLLEVVALTTGAAVFFNARGFTAA